jgi:hypothetical protein
MAAKKAKKSVKKASKMKDMKAGKSASKVKGGVRKAGEKPLEY